MPKSLRPVLNSTLTRSALDWGVLTFGIIMLAVAVAGTFVDSDVFGPGQVLDQQTSAFLVL